MVHISEVKAKLFYKGWLSHHQQKVFYQTVSSFWHVETLFFQSLTSLEPALLYNLAEQPRQVLHGLMLGFCSGWLVTIISHLL